MKKELKTIGFECQTCAVVVEVPCEGTSIFTMTAPPRGWRTERIMLQSGNMGFTVAADVHYCSTVCADVARTEEGPAVERLASFRRGLLRLTTELQGTLPVGKPTLRVVGDGEG